MYKVQVQRM